MENGRKVENATTTVKRASSGLLGFLILAVPTAVHAQFTYATNAYDTITITRYIGTGAVTIPTNFDGLAVTTIGEGAFYECADVDSVTIPNSITDIGQRAFRFSGLTSVTVPGSVSSIEAGTFSDCTSLTNATLENGVTNIGDYAFQGCFSLAQVTIPDSVTSIGDVAFAGCIGLTSVNLPAGLTSIGSIAFSDTPLTNLTIPASVTSIETNAFQDCIVLTSVFFQGNAPVAEASVFTNVNATVYYLPGTTGWSNQFAGLPAVLWNPLIQTGDASFGVRSNKFGFNITGTNDFMVVVEASTNLASPVWTPLQTNTLTKGAFYFSDPQWTNYSSRYYSLGLP
jgi:hypothetical protein